MNKQLTTTLIITLSSILIIGVMFSIPKNSQVSGLIATEPTLATHTIVLDGSNTPPTLDKAVQWDNADAYKVHRYTEFHYAYNIKVDGYHSILANYGNGGYLQNSMPLRYAYTLTVELENNSWSEITLSTSDVYGNPNAYQVVDTIIMAAWNNTTHQTLTLATATPYFAIWKSDGTQVNIKTLTITYEC